MAEDSPHSLPPTTGVPAPAPPSIWRDRALLVLLGCLVVLLGWRWYWDHHGAKPTDVTRSPKHLVDLNRATAADLGQLPGVGPQTAERVVRHREQNGPFRSLDDLKQVGGIGDKTVAKLAPWVTLSSPAAETLTPEPDRLSRGTPAVAAAPTRSVSLKPNLPAERLNVNTATAEELEKLPGIGRVLAQRIIDARTVKPFTNVEDLRRVGGIGVKKLDAIRDLVAVSN